MKKVTAESIKQSDGRWQQGIFALAKSEVREGTSGKYVVLTLTDATGSFKAYWFDQKKLPNNFKIGSAVEITGKYSQQYANLNVEAMRPYDGEIEPADFLATLPKRTMVHLLKEFKELHDSIKDPDLKIVVEEGLGGHTERLEKFSKWPAAQMIHHAYLGGLLEHTVNVTKSVAHDCELYGTKRDLAVAGALLHDIGKIQEIDVGLIITYTDKGRLFGHTVLGYEMVKAHTDNEELLHIIASHHGKREHGAMQTPHTLEAYLVHAADKKDYMANRYNKLIEEQKERPENVSGVDYFLETRVYAKKAD